MNKLKQVAETYDQMFSGGGYQGVYDLPYWHCGYYPLFKRVRDQVLRRGAKSVLEVGCGTGAFAHLLMTTTSIKYRGFDFSKVAVAKAIARTRQPAAFYVGNAVEDVSYAHDSYDCIVCTEVLEHLEQDLEVIKKWQPGTFCVCSVPNFDDETHVRHFDSIDQVRTRYAPLIAIDGVARVKKPVLTDISVRNRLRAIRWYRNRPGQLMAVLGLGTFQSVGGWFIFHGVKR